MLTTTPFDHALNTGTHKKPKVCSDCGEGFMGINSPRCTTCRIDRKKARMKLAKKKKRG